MPGQKIAGKPEELMNVCILCLHIILTNISLRGKKASKDPDTLAKADTFSVVYIFSVQKLGCGGGGGGGGGNKCFYCIYSSKYICFHEIISASSVKNKTNFQQDGAKQMPTSMILSVSASIFSADQMLA